MTWTQTITVSTCVYLTAVMLLHCSPSAARPIKAPTIVNLSHKRLAHGYRISCKVNPGGLRDETMVYWLVNGEFIEKVYQNISVTKTERKSDDGTEFISTKVVFRDFSQEDFNTQVTCVALSPAGFAKENIRIRKYRRH
ncbi:interleukin-1 receptor type 2-like [Tachysurus ichikawai]